MPHPDDTKHQDGSTPHPFMPLFPETYRGDEHLRESGETPMPAGWRSEIDQN